MPQNSYTLPEASQRVLGYSEEKDEYSVIIWDGDEKGWRKCDSPESLWKLSYFTTWEYLPDREVPESKRKHGWIGIVLIIVIVGVLYSLMVYF